MRISKINYNNNNRINKNIEQGKITQPLMSELKN